MQSPRIMTNNLSSLSQLLSKRWNWAVMLQCSQLCFVEQRISSHFFPPFFPPKLSTFIYLSYFNLQLISRQFTSYTMLFFPSFFSITFNYFSISIFGTQNLHLFSLRKVNKINWLKNNGKKRMKNSCLHLPIYCVRRIKISLNERQEVIV